MKNFNYESSTPNFLDILTLVDPKLKNAAQNAGHHVPCPLPGHENSKDGFRFFEDAAETGSSICNTCGAFRDPIDLVMCLKACNREEANSLINTAYETLTGNKLSISKLSSSSLKTLSRAIQSHPRKTDYLAYRGLQDSNDVLFSEKEFHSKSDTGKGVYRPAIVSYVRNQDGEIVNVHKIFLSKKHDGKTSLNPAKKFGSVVKQGDSCGCAIYLGEAEEIMAVTEGVETGLAVRQATGLPVAVMPTTLMPRINFPKIVREVHIYADNDSAGQGDAAADKLADKLLAEGKTVALWLPDEKDSDFLDVLNKYGEQGVLSAQGFDMEEGTEEPDSSPTDDKLVQMPLMRDYGNAPDFPVAALGTELKSYVDAIHDYTQAPISMIASSVLAATTLSVQAQADVSIRGDKKPISAFFLTIGKSGERKSTVDNLALKPIRDYEDELRTQLPALKLAYDIKLKEYNKKKQEDSATDNEGSYLPFPTFIECTPTDGEGEDLLIPASSTTECTPTSDEIQLPPKKPRGALMLIDDATPEGLYRFLQDEQLSTGVFSEEGGRFFGGHAMTSDNRLKTITAYSMLWDAKPLKSVRKADGTSVVTGVRMSSHLMIQPEVAKAALGDQLLMDQGYWGRVLIAFPDSTIGLRKYTKPSKESESTLAKYRDKIGALIRRPQMLNENGELLPRALLLSDDAEDLYIDFYNDIEEQQGENGLYKDISPFASKSGEHALRLAAVLTLFDDTNAEYISSARMRDAITIIGYYLSEANRLLGTTELDKFLLHAEKTLKWMQRTPNDLFPITRIYQTGPKSVRSAKDALKVMNILEEHNWVEKVEWDEERGGVPVNGSIHKEVWSLV